MRAAMADQDPALAGKPLEVGAEGFGVAILLRPDLQMRPENVRLTRVDDRAQVMVLDALEEARGDAVTENLLCHLANELLGAVG